MLMVLSEVLQQRRTTKVITTFRISDIFETQNLDNEIHDTFLSVWLLSLWRFRLNKRELRVKLVNSIMFACGAILDKSKRERMVVDD